MSLGDAYALATAEAVDGTLLAGADDDFDEVDASVERLRHEPA
jgi:predicted nucleic acid-binding protein